MRLVLSFFIVVSPLLTGAQLSLSVNGGIGTYKMSDLKKLQTNMSESIPVEARTTTSFPSYWFYEFSATRELENKEVIGATLGYGSTGSRLYYSDYSGRWSFDQLALFYSISTVIGKRVSIFNGKLAMQGDVRPGVTYTNLSISTKEVIGPTANSNHRKFDAVNFVLQPTISLTYKWEFMSLNLFAGYNFNIAKSELHASDNSATVLNTGGSKSQPAHADWSGLRAGVGIAFDLSEGSYAERDKFSVGVGVGLDYGGIGVNLTMYPQKYVGFFVGAGHAVAGFGTNAGIKLRFINETSKVHPYFVGMYGYNTGVVVIGHASYNKLFYGPSVGIGMDWARSASGSRLWSFALLVPIRGPEVDSYVRGLKAQGVEFRDALPVLASIGYRIVAIRD